MDGKKTKTSLVMFTTENIINYFSISLDKSYTKEKLAGLRNSIGRPFEESIEALQIVFENLPEELLGGGYKLTNEELAIFTTLQLYASYQQSKSESVNLSKNDGMWKNIGDSLSALRSAESSLSTDDRFNAMITSQSFEELIVHLRHMLKLLKSKKLDVKINFVNLSKDLYYYLYGNTNSIKLNWARSYYKTKIKKEENEGEKND